MLTTTRLLLKKQTHNDNAGRWDVPLNWNFQAIDDDIAALALVLTGSTQGAWSAFQTTLDDYTASKSSTLGANATASLNGRLNYDQERNLVDDPTYTAHESHIKGRGSFFNSKNLSIPSNWWSYEGGVDPFTVTLHTSTLDINGGISTPVVLSGVKYRYYRPIGLSITVPFPVGLNITYRYPVFACGIPSAALLAANEVFIDGQTSRSSIPAVYGKGTTTIGTSVFTVAVNGGHAISDADVGDSDWKPKAGNTLEIYTGGSISDRYKILTVAGNDITIVGKFPRTIAASDWNVMDYRQCNFVILPDNASSDSLINLFYSCYGSDLFATSMIHLGWISCFSGGGAPASMNWIENNITKHKLHGITIPKSFQLVHTWSDATVKYEDLVSNFGQLDVFKNVMFYAVVNGNVVYNPTCTPSAGVSGVPCFNLTNDTASGHLIIGRVKDKDSAGTSVFCQYYTAASATPVSGHYGDVSDWGFLIDLNV